MQALVTPIPSAESNIEKARAARWTPEARRAASRKAKKRWKARKESQLLQQALIVHSNGVTA